jgi:hypothetical protein
MYENIAHNISDDIIENIDWKDPLASCIISDSSTIVENLSSSDKKTFMVRLFLSNMEFYLKSIIIITLIKIPAYNMCPTLSNAIKLECRDLLDNYNTFNDDLCNMILKHNKEWIDDLDTQKKITRDIFNVL